MNYFTQGNILHTMVIYLKRDQPLSDIIPWVQRASLFPASTESVDGKRLNAQKYVSVLTPHYNPWKRTTQIGQRTSKIFIGHEIAINLLQGDAYLGKLLHGLEVYLSAAGKLKISEHEKVTQSNRRLVEKFINECIIVEPKPGMDEISIYMQRQYGLKSEDSIDAATSIFLGTPLLSLREQFKLVNELIFVWYQP